MKTKNITKGILMMFIASLTLTSCEDEVNELQTGASVEAGAYARILTSSADKTTNLLNPSASSFDATIEFVDSESGNLVDSYAIFVAFKDNTIASDTAPDNSIVNEVLVQTWEKSSFVPGTKYPTLDFTLSSQDAIDKLGLDLAIAEGGDTFVYRGEITLSDGRTFSSTNSGVSVNAELFFNDAFSFSSAFVCVPDQPIAGDWIITMEDSYGDGWDGAYIVVTVDDVATEYTIDGATGSHTITIPIGTTSLEWEYVPGSWESEHSFKVYAPSGNLVLSDGPGPAAGLLALNLCNE
jgi:hypothetical protein